jgi:hypothetical protein
VGFLTKEGELEEGHIVFELLIPLKINENKEEELWPRGNRVAKIFLNAS